MPSSETLQKTERYFTRFHLEKFICDTIPYNLRFSRQISDNKINLIDTLFFNCILKTNVPLFSMS